MRQIVRSTLFVLTLLCISFNAYAQPANDNCSNAIPVTITGNGFDIGTFTSAQVDIDNATVESGESFAPAILVAGQSQKSIWYKFTIPTTRKIRVTLSQVGTSINAGDVGFAVYRNDNCLPGNTQISTKLTPISVFGNTFHPCVDSSVYLVQVSGKASVIGKVYISVETDYPDASYDRPSGAYNFGTLAQGVSAIGYMIDCQSIENTTETCINLSGFEDYTKSTWHVFKTPAYYDFISLMVAHQAFVPSNIIGFKIYEGDVTTSDYNTLPVVVDCDSLETYYYYFARRTFKCGELDVNKTYSLQLFFKNNFEDAIKVVFALGGTTPTQAPQPVNTMLSPSNNLGVLSSSLSGVNTNTSDFFGCNSRHSVSSCPPSILPYGVKTSNNYNYNLSSFVSFTLSTTSNISLNASNSNCGGSLLIRLYNQAPGTNCGDLDTANIIGTYPGYSNTISCLPAGTYTLQVMGRDTASSPNSYYYGSFSNGHSTSFICAQTDLGTKYNLSINVISLPTPKYTLSTPGAYDSINAVAGVILPLQLGVTYQSMIDSFGCANTLLPLDTECATGYSKAIYRQFEVADSSVLFLTGTWHWNKLYKGDADALATAQNLTGFPQKIQGLDPASNCITSPECGGTRICVVPGTYTHVTFGAEGNITQASQPSYQLKSINSLFGDPANAEDMGDLLAQIPAAGGSKVSAQDVYSCRNNAVVIDGFIPCSMNGAPAGKAIYRQFYLSAPASVSISGYHYDNSCSYTYGGYNTIFSGKATDGLSTLTVTDKSALKCFQYYNPSNCEIFEPGWYTIVSYGAGPSYDSISPPQYGNSGYVGYSSQITITITPACPGPKYNRPNKAAIDSVTNAPFLIEWGPKQGHTAAYPKTDTTYKLYREYFNCTVDTPFISHPIPTCNSNLTKVAYWVFEITQESYIQINTFNYWGAVYQGNARNGTSGFDSSTMIQTCLASSGRIQICKIQPGFYTLVVFADNTHNCTSVEPTIYIDKVGYSRFDHANNAYDFGLIPSDSAWYNGKPGDVNPLDPTRAPSNDFIYCTTGAQQNDPADPSCESDYLPGIYSGGNNIAMYSTEMNASTHRIPRRNLWYSFVADKGGYVRIKVENKTIGKQYQYRYGVYKSNADGTIDFSSLVSTGQVDSTISLGLNPIVGNNYYWYCYGGTSEVSFYRDPCSSIPERYYILVENVNTYYSGTLGMNPNSQVEVSVLMDSINAIQPLFDHYSTAGNIGDNLGEGSYTGPTDNFSCATYNPLDPINTGYCSTPKKTLWYKFSVSITGTVRYRIKINNAFVGSYYYYDQLQLFKEITPGDSTSAGLVHMNYSNTPYADGGYWAERCITPGTYYIVLPGCGRVNEYVFPELQLLEQKGDFCTAPMVATLNGPGTSVTPVIIDCHTIGTDYGEFNPTLTCPNGANRNDYKTSWFRLDVTGSDTLDVTTYLTENTNVLPSQIKYRMMDGDCGAMQERSCVQDAQTQDTYKCLLPGKSYFFQVFTPVNATGSINLNLSAVVHADTCATEKNCLSTAVFIPEFDCTLNDSVRFNNLSTYGAGITYEWDFGYNGQTSTAVSPVFAYPSLATAQTYTVKLKVTNTGCVAGSINVDSTSMQITMPGRPNVSLGADTIICTNAASMLLDATSHTGSTYQWSTGHTTPTITANYSGVNNYWVKVEYNGCIKRDTIRIGINPIVKVQQEKFLCGNDSIQLNSNRGVGETHNWSNGSNNYFIYASTGNLYTNNVNWQGCTIVDSFNIITATEPFSLPDTSICAPFQPFVLNAFTPEAQSYTWHDNSTGPTFNVTSPGTYSVQVWNGTCSKKDTVNVITSAAVIDTLTEVTICSGTSFTLPWGGIVNTAGIYSDTIRYAGGCDSLIHKVDLNVTSVNATTTYASICSGESFTLPWGSIVTDAGFYADTIRALSGCDSIIRHVNISMNAVIEDVQDAVICAGANYVLPWGSVVTSAGTYADTIQYVSGGCDSLIRTVNLLVNPVIEMNEVVTICSGSNYTLPWGDIVSAAGIYRDTVFYALSGCDSLRLNYTINVDQPQFISETELICDGSSFTLPWGDIVSAAGIYSDTIRSVAGCDSVIHRIDLGIRTVIIENTTATICEGANYNLPWGTIVTSPGIYSDTIQYLSGCDSLIRHINLEVFAPTINHSTAFICNGQTFTLPWGGTVTTAGIYSDTIYYVNGCDSIINSVDLSVYSTLTENATATFCAGSSYTLPWGTIVNTAGVYSDTLRYINGCDSLIRFVDLSIQDVTIQNTEAVICSGASFTLPWGAVVSATGVYTDTLHYQSGCDSLIRIVSLTSRDLILNTQFAIICAGTSYNLPWGGTATSTGVYSDTLHYNDGCDSLITTINLTVQNVLTESGNVNICQGSNYVLPWGTSVNTSGVYSDTIKYQSGCDSLIRTITINVQNKTFESTAVSICQGATYTLPWGAVVNSPGTYTNTLTYPSGCDSLTREIILEVKPVLEQNLTANTCWGMPYVLPWGQLASTEGIYRDTIRYVTGCDSLRTSVSLTVTMPQTTTTSASICSDEIYALPWGGVVNISGIYSDTTRNAAGCITLIRVVDLIVNPSPVISLTKSNDIDCMLGTARLTASGGASYEWWPAISLDHPFTASPVAAPVATTVYHVVARSTENCISEDSIIVNVNLGDANGGYPVASAFTPNGDGKNDCFGVRHWGAVTNFKMNIFSRWGEIVYTTSNPQECWDGRYKGTRLGSEVFVYVITANTICGEILRKGTVTVIR